MQKDTPLLAAGSFIQVSRKVTISGPSAQYTKVMILAEAFMAQQIIQI